MNNSWTALGKPVIWNSDIAEAARLIKELYECEPAGGPLHVELDDWNIDAEVITPMYVIPARGNAPGYPDHFSPLVHALCDRIAELLTDMPVGWRASALAHAEGRAVEGRVV